METEQPVLDLTEQEPKDIISNNYIDAEMDFSAFDLDLGF